MNGLCVICGTNHHQCQDHPFTTKEDVAKPEWLTGDAIRDAIMEIGTKDDPGPLEQHVPDADSLDTELRSLRRELCKAQATVARLTQDKKVLQALVEDYQKAVDGTWRHHLIAPENVKARFDELTATVARLTGERDAQAGKRLEILLDDNCIATIKKLTPEGGEEISFGGVMGGVRLKWNGAISPESTETALTQAQQALRPEKWIEVFQDSIGQWIVTVFGRIFAVEAEESWAKQQAQLLIDAANKWLAEAALPSDTPPQKIQAHSKSEYKRLVVQAEGKNVVVEPPSDTQGAQAQEVKK